MGTKKMLFTQQPLRHVDEDPRNFHRYPLLSRGWAYQERLLSGRVLHFAKDKWSLHCQKEVVIHAASS
jgi:hypothetical protein